MRPLHGLVTFFFENLFLSNLHSPGKAHQIGRVKCIPHHIAENVLVYNWKLLWPEKARLLLGGWRLNLRLSGLIGWRRSRSPRFGGGGAAAGDVMVGHSVCFSVHVATSSIQVRGSSSTAI